jgi:hypothetical protein
MLRVIGTSRVLYLRKYKKGRSRVDSLPFCSVTRTVFSRVTNLWWLSARSCYGIAPHSACVDGVCLFSGCHAFRNQYIFRLRNQGHCTARNRRTDKTRNHRGIHRHCCQVRRECHQLHHASTTLCAARLDMTACLHWCSRMRE